MSICFLSFLVGISCGGSTEISLRLFDIELLSRVSLYKGLGLKSVDKLNVYIIGLQLREGPYMYANWVTGLVCKPDGVLKGPLNLFLEPGIPIFF